MLADSDKKNNNNKKRDDIQRPLSNLPSISVTFFICNLTRSLARAAVRVASNQRRQRFLADRLIESSAFASAVAGQRRTQSSSSWLHNNGARFATAAACQLLCIRIEPRPDNASSCVESSRSAAQVAANESPTWRCRLVLRSCSCDSRQAKRREARGESRTRAEQINRYEKRQRKKIFQS